MKKTLLFLLIIFCLFINNYAFAVEKKADVTLILLDISTSMNKSQIYDGERLTRFDVALKSIDKILKQYSYSDKIGLRTIGISSTKMIDDLSNNPDKVANIIQGSNNPFLTLYNKTCNQSELVVPITNSSLSQIYDVLKFIKDDGTSTPIEYTLRQAIEVDFAQFSQSVKKHIIIITDGYEGCGGNPCGYIKNLSQKRDDIIIDVVSVLPETADFSLYYCLTATTGGGIFNPANVKPSFNSNVDFKQITPACPKCTEKNSILNPLENNIQYRSFLLQFE
jgi:hypothetical protein